VYALPAAVCEVEHHDAVIGSALAKRYGVVAGEQLDSIGVEAARPGSSPASRSAAPRSRAPTAAPERAAVTVLLP
jgi:hypothetical protein